MAIRIVSKVLDVPITNHLGEFLAGAYRTEHPENKEITADHLVVYRNRDVVPSLLRVNSACYTGDIFHDRRCDCNWQLETALRVIAERDQGVLLYHMHHEGRAHGIVEKLRSYAVADALGRSGKVAYEALGVHPDARQYQSSVLILKDLGLMDVVLMSNNPHKRAILEDSGIVVSDTIPIKSPDPGLEGFYAWKREDFGHSV